MNGYERGIYLLGFVYGLLVSVFITITVVGVKFHVMSLTMIGVPGVVCSVALFLITTRYISSFYEMCWMLRQDPSFDSKKMV